jgi:hypothetical protein
LYREAFNWKTREISAGMEDMLLDHNELGNADLGGKWVSLISLGMSLGMEEPVV